MPSMASKVARCAMVTLFGMALSLSAEEAAKTGTSQESKTEPKPAEKEIIVEAEKPKDPPKPAVKETRDATEVRRLDDPVPATGVDSKTFLKRPDRRAADVIKRLPGLYMEGPPGEAKDLRPRGLDKEFGRAQFDGVQIPCGGEKREFQLNRMPSFMLGEVEFVRNPSAEYQSDGLAGRVVAKSRPIPEELTVEGRVGYGGRNGLGGELYGGNVGFGMRPTKWFGVMAAFDFLENSFDRQKPKRFSDGRRELEDEPEGQTAINGLADLGFYYGPGELHIKPVALVLDKRKEKTKTVWRANGTVDNLEEEDEDFLQDTYGVSIKHNHKLTKNAELETTGGYFETTEDKNKTKPRKVPSGATFRLDRTNYEPEYKVDRTGELNSAVLVKVDAALKHEIKAGGSLRLRERFREKEVIEVRSNGQRFNRTTPKDTYYLEEDYFAGFVQDRMAPIENFSFMPGVRVEHLARRTRDAGGPEEEACFTDVNPTFHMLWKARKDLSVKFGFSRTVNYAKFDELSPYEQERGSTDLVIGNPGLKNAYAHNFDLGADYSTEHARFGVNFFYKQVYDNIAEIDTGEIRNGRRVYQISNVGDGTVQGIELEQRLNLGITKVKGFESLTLWANQTLLDSELEIAPNFKRRFKEQPALIYNLGFDFDYEPTGTGVSLGVSYLGKRRDFQTASTKLKFAETTVDISVRQRINKHLHFFIEAENVTNEDTVEINRFPNGTWDRKTETGGRSLFMGIGWNF